MSTEDKAQAVYAILSDVYDVSPWTYEQILADMAQAHTDYYYAYDGDETVGFMSLDRLIGETELTNIAVKSRYQGKGYARKLLSHLAEEDNPIFLEVRASNKSAIKLYESVGFQLVGRRKEYYHAPCEDALLMKKED